MKKVMIGKFTFKHKIFNKISESAKNLISKMLTINYHKRISAEEALKDTWFKKALEYD